MKIKIILLAIFCCTAIIKAQQKKFIFYFENGKQTPHNAKAFNDSLQKWKNNGAHIVSIKGYADSRGSAVLNRKLSMKRSLKTEALVRKSISSAGKTVVKAYGEKFPVASNKTQSGRSKNRRVEVVIDFEKIPEGIIAAPVVKEVKLLSDPEPEREDTTFLLPNGTEITIKKCALKGLKYSDIRIEAKEYLTPDVMMANGMFSQSSDGTCLRTGGMLQYRLTDAKGKLLGIDNTCPINISIPAINADTAMDLYELPETPVAANQKNTNMVHGDKWVKQNGTVRFDKTRNRYRFTQNQASAYVNCDKYRGPLNQFAVQENWIQIFFTGRNYIKTKKIKNADIFVSGDASVMKLERFAPKKHSKLLCDCIPLDKQYFTSWYKKGNSYYFFHEKVTKLQASKNFDKKLKIRKNQYTRLASYNELMTALKKAVGNNASVIANR